MPIKFLTLKLRGGRASICTRGPAIESHRKQKIQEQQLIITSQFNLPDTFALVFFLFFLNDFTAQQE